MKRLWILGLGALALGLAGTPSRAQQVQAERKAGDMPGPIDSLDDLQDTGRMVFKLADENNDGQISQKEAVDAGNLIVGGFFFRADKDGNGVLTKEESDQAREAFLSSKPWLKYAVETVRANQNRAGNNNTNPQNMLAGLASTFDTNQDKQLQAAELRQAVQTVVQGGFATADTNRDGQLSTTEVNAAMTGFSRQLAQAAFQQADKDNNGQLSTQEFEQAILQPARTAFQIMDLNHDGQLSQQEAQTARQVIASRLRALNLPEASNSPKNTINSALGNQAQPAPAEAPNAPPR